MLTRLREGIVARFTRADAVRLVSSLILAMILWGYVSVVTDPEETGIFPGLQLDPGSDLPSDFVITTQLPSVTVRLTAAESVMEDITSADISVRLDVDEVDEPGSYTVPVRVDSPDDIRSESVNPSQASITVERIATRDIELAFAVEQLPESDSRRVGQVQPSVSTVTVTGPESVVSRVATVELPVQIGSHTQTFEETFRPRAVNAEGVEIPEAVIQPETVTTTVPIIQRGRLVAVLVDLVGTPAPGYQVRETRTVPLNIVVDGADELLAEIVIVYTDPVDITGATEDVTASVAIDLERLPDGVRIIDPSTGQVQVIVQISDLASSQTLPGQTVQVMGLGPGLEAALDPAQISVAVETSAEQIQLLQPGDIVVSVNLAGLGPGTHQLAPSVSVPAEMLWIRTDPDVVTVTITEADAFNGDALPGLGSTGTPPQAEESPEASPAVST